MATGKSNPNVAPVVPAAPVAAVVPQPTPLPECGPKQVYIGTINGSLIEGEVFDSLKKACDFLCRKAGNPTAVIRMTKTGLEAVGLGHVRAKLSNIK